MTAIQIPRRYMPGYRKPRVSANRLCQIDWDNPLSRGLIVFMLPVPGGALDIVSGRFFSKNSSYSTVPDFGQLSRFNSSGGQSVEVLSNVGSWPSSPGITAGCVARYSAATVGSDDCMVDFRNDANTWRLKLTTQSPTGQSYRVFAKNSSSKSINYSGGPDPNDNQVHRVIASIGNNSDLRLDVDNVGVQTTSAGSGSPQIADDFKLGSDGGGGSFQGAIYCAYGFSRQLSETEMLALNANPWQLVKPLFPAIHFSVGGAAILTISDVDQSVSVDALNLVQANTLALADADQSVSVDAPNLVQANTLALADADQSVSVDALNLVQANTLALADADQSVSVDALNLVQANTLALTDAGHSHSADNVVLSSGENLVVGDADQVVSADNLGLVQANILVINDTDHAVIVDALSLIQANVLAVLDALHASSTDNIDLLQANTLAVTDADHSHTADPLSLVQSNILATADALHGNAVDNIELELAGVLSVADALQQASADNLVITQAHTIVVNSALSNQISDSLNLSQGFSLLVDSADHVVQADPIVLDTTILLAVLDAAQSVAVDPVALVQSGTLIVSDSLHASLVDAVNLSLPGVFEFPGRRVMVVQNAVRSYVVVNSATRNLTEY